MNIETYRARATNVWASGADGIQIFNCFDPTHPLWQELGSPETLRGLTKHYYCTYLGPRMAKGYLVGGDKYVRVPTLCPYAPVSLEPGQTHATTVNIGEDVNSIPDKASPSRITLSLQVNGLRDPSAMTVHLNGTPLGVGRLKDDWVEFDVSAESVKQHENRVEIGLSENAEAALSVRDLMVSVEYGD